MGQIDVELKTWEGRELPVWRFADYTDLERYMEMGPDAWIAELLPDLPERMWGVIYRDYPMEPEQAIAVIYVDEDVTPDQTCEDAFEAPEE